MSYAPLRTAVNLPTTTRTLANGVPFAPRLSLNVRAAADAHGHGHGHGVASRADIPSTRISSISRSQSAGLVSRTSVNVVPTVNLSQRFIHSSVAARDAPQVPDFTPYQAKSETANRAMSYFMVGSLGVLTASVAKSTLTEFLGTMSASADVLALAKVEVELGTIPEGKNVIIKWRGKPVFIRHRTPDEIEEARQVNVASLRDPETDEARTKKPEWLVMLGVCTHLGCVPIGESGDYGGWFCPCHGSHYDISGRARKGPAPTNLEIPEYSFDEDGEKLIIG
ncbi:hypothetical protein M422DRAFT_227293 [Sphaerobolus stellatus SS14]|uniref:Cytochrome b-c1 complex subunit Rieske, mitochondrial n=1 Tax=Sphaerobolus stellatus (strain SS14) TaxID=990650 RepID=A0A0C9W3A5_SPHS4|nr:hypothetical protein M422DRAFT_227293 [Sphaerobolus stellatus SS14]